MTNDFGSLVILVPGSQDYAAYCRTVVEDVLRCVPIGLWRYLSFATNPDEVGKRNFAVLFAPEGTMVRAGERSAIRLDDETWPVSHTLRPETAELIRRGGGGPRPAAHGGRPAGAGGGVGAADGGALCELLAAVPAQRQAHGLHCPATVQQPAGPEPEPPGAGPAGGGAEEPPERPRQPGAGPGAGRDPDGGYHAGGAGPGPVGLRPCFRALDRGVDRIFSARLLDRILSSGRRTLEQLAEDGRRLDRCGSAAEDGLLDREAVRQRREKLDRETEAANRLRKEAFERAIPAAWDWDRLRGLLDGLKPCREEVRHSCRSALARLAAEHLEEAGLSESRAREFYAQITGLLGGGPELAPLEAWYRTWQQHLEERRAVLEGMTSYRAYLALGRRDEACLDRLLDWFDNSGYRSAGVKDLLQAAELEWGEAWPRLLDRLEDLLRVLGQRHRLGVWLEPGKRWEDLYSELLACRIIGQKTGEGKICLWYQGAGEARPMKLSKVLETVEMLQPVVLDGKRDSGGWYNREALRVILDAGMVSREEVALLRDVLDAKDLDLLDRSGTREGKKKPRRSFRVPAVWKIAVLAAVALVLGVLLFSQCSGPQPSGAPDTEQSGTPGGGSVHPSAGQDGEIVTPRQPDTE